MFRSRLLLAISVLGTASMFEACSCAGMNTPDSGDPDASVDAGPVTCTTNAECAAAELADFVCDPTNRVCQPKCTDDSQCEYIGNGFCEKRDGTCRGRCDDTHGPLTSDGGTDYCAELGDLLCLPATGKCVEKCHRDDDCSAIEPGTRCNATSGQCIHTGVHGCSMDSDCNNFFEPDDYCFLGGVQCRCVTEANDAGNTGICRQRRAACDECTDPVQCGTGTTFDPAGTCKTLQGDTSGKKYCLQQHNGPCTCGYVDDGTGYCKPMSNTCAMPGCAEDKDCKAGAVCNKASCLCEPRCRWDFAAKDVAAPGCGPGKTCWVDNQNLDPTSIYYGAGRCRPPCTDNTQCTDTAQNPNAGPKLTCGSEKLAGGGMSDKRCRANGECMDNLECPEQPDTSNYFGYCDRGAFVCKLDCRVGLDPVTNKAYGDCRSPYACAAPGDGGTNICRLQTCLEQGGASIACNRGEYCCGEDKDNNGAADPCPPPSDQGPDKCYTAPSPPFCKSCMSTDECQTLQLPAWLQGACANGSRSPSCSPFPTICIGVDMNTAVCAPSTYNDNTRDSNGVGRDNKGCPAGYSARYIRAQFTDGSGDDFCTADSDCNVGTDAGRCAADPTNTLSDGGHPKACLCTVGQPAQCPNSEDGGVFSFCRFGVTGAIQACMQTVACVPGAVVVHADAGAPLFGCGIP